MSLGPGPGPVPDLFDLLFLPPLFIKSNEKIMEQGLTFLILILLLNYTHYIVRLMIMMIIKILNFKVLLIFIIPRIISLPPINMSFSIDIPPKVVIDPLV
jgi:hypothetical protein